MSGPHGAQLADLLLVLERRVAALHRGEHAIRAGLHRQVQIVRELRHVAIRLDQRVLELDRMRGREADALDARHFGDVIDQRAEIAQRAVVHRAVVGVDVLAEQRDLAHALARELRESPP